MFLQKKGSGQTYKRTQYGSDKTNDDSLVKKRFVYMLFFFAEGKPDTEFRVPAQSTEQPRVPEDDGQGKNQNRDHNTTHAVCISKIFIEAALILELYHFRGKFIGIIRICRVKRFFDGCCFFIIIYAGLEISQDFAGRILHIEGNLCIGDIDNNGAAVECRGTETDRTRDDEVCECHTSIHGRTEEGDFISDSDTEPVCKIMADQCFTGLVRNGTGNQRFANVHTGQFPGTGREQIDALTDYRSLRPGIPAGIGDIE